jgi:hypothetical protein
MAAAMQEQKQQFWQKTWFVESTWISTSTKWLLTFGGKAARIVLIICTLYMSAQLYPGVTLPPGLNLAVFIILSFALDMGGLGLAQIAKTARQHGNVDGATQGEKLSTWLIGIMIAGLVTVSLEHAVDMIPFTKDVKNYIAAFWIVIEIALSIARVICAVNYGHVVHALEHSIEEQIQTLNVNSQIPEFLKKIEDLEHQLKKQSLNPEVQTLKVEIQGYQESLKNQQEQFKIQTDLIQSLKVEIQGYQQDVKTLKTRQFTANTPTFTQPAKPTLERHTEPTPVIPKQPVQLHPLPTSSNNRQATTNSTPTASEADTKRFSKSGFVRNCLKENPEMSAAEIKDRALKIGQTISDPIISMARNDLKNQHNLKAVGQ